MKIEDAARYSSYKEYMRALVKEFMNERNAGDGESIEDIMAHPGYLYPYEWSIAKDNYMPIFRGGLSVLWG